MNYTIVDNPSAHRFETTVDGELAIAEYQRVGNVLRMTHTLVPEAIEGRGVAAALARHALDHARSHHLKVDPQCAYVRQYMDHHPDTADLRA